MLWFGAAASACSAPATAAAPPRSAGPAPEASARTAPPPPADSAQQDGSDAVAPAANIDFPPLTFEHGSRELSPESSETLKRISDEFRSHPDHRVAVSGHADASEKPKELPLSSFRARAVRDALVALGVPVERLTVYAFGDDKPRADQGTEEGQARNRRVEVSLIPPPPPHHHLVVPVYGSASFMPAAGFPPRSDEITPALYRSLEGVAEVLLAQPGVNIEVEGHADPSEPHANRLSERRARAAMKLLVELGVPEARLSAKGYGSKVNVEGIEEDQKVQNRSVGFRITKGELED